VRCNVFGLTEFFVGSVGIEHSGCQPDRLWQLEPTPMLIEGVHGVPQASTRPRCTARDHAYSAARETGAVSWGAGSGIEEIRFKARQPAMIIRRARSCPLLQPTASRDSRVRGKHACPLILVRWHPIRRKVIPRFFHFPPCWRSVQVPPARLLRLILCAALMQSRSGRCVHTVWMYGRRTAHQASMHTPLQI